MPSHNWRTKAAGSAPCYSHRKQSSKTTANLLEVVGDSREIHFVVLPNKCICLFRLIQTKFKAQERSKGNLSWLKYVGHCLLLKHCLTVTSVLWLQHFLRHWHGTSMKIWRSDYHLLPSCFGSMTQILHADHNEASNDIIHVYFVTGIVLTVLECYKCSCCIVHWGLFCIFFFFKRWMLYWWRFISVSKCQAFCERIGLA